MNRWIRLMLLVFLAGSLFACDDDGEHTGSDAGFDGVDDQYREPEGPGPWIMIDLYHSSKQNPLDYKLQKGNFSYQGVFAYWRMFEHIQNNGYKTVYNSDRELSADTLDGFDVLFINLVSEDRPDFSEDEVQAIITFVEGGGGLYVIVDHTNVYKHAERVNKFLMPMGVEALYHIATDRPPVYSVAGTAWILVRSFAEHPVTEGVGVISLQTGGPVRTESSGVAFTSSCEGETPVNCSFADHWDPNDPHGYYGNWTWDGDIEVEPIGPLEVVAAHEYGEGRIVVVGDQNIFGDCWLHFGDNFELAMNSIDWLAKRENQAQLRDTAPMGFNIGVLQPHTQYYSGKNANEGYFGYYVNENRDLNVTSRGIERLDQKDDALMLMNPLEPFSEADLSAVGQYMKDGKPVVLTFEIAQINDSVITLLNEFAPGFTVTIDGTDYGLDQVEELKAALTKTAGTQALSSSYLDVAELDLAAFLNESDTDENGDRITVYRPYLWDVKSSWGEPFLTTDKSDIARVTTANGGHFVVFIQDAFFRGRTMGDYLWSPNNEGVSAGKSMAGSGYANAHRLQFALHDWFIADKASE